jgi:DNA invertase Pin-like site-specific DNA recombinase
MRVAIYARVSTRDKGQDPENQVHQVRAFAEQPGSIYHVFTEEVSGCKSDRSQFK